MGHAAVILDNNSTAHVETNGPSTMATLSNFMVGSGTDRLLTVFIAGESVTANSVMYGTTAMTLAVSAVTGQTAGANDYASIWYLLNPAEGSFDITATVPSTGSSWHLDAASFFGVSQTAPTTAMNVVDTDTTTPSVTIAANGTGVIVDAFDANNDRTPTAGPGQTVIYADGANVGGFTAGASYEIGTFTTETQTWSITGGTGGNQEFVHVAAFFAEAIPEPSSALLIGLGSITLLARRRRA